MSNHMEETDYERVHRIIVELSGKGEEILQPEVNEKFQIEAFGQLYPEIRENGVITSTTRLEKEGSIRRERVTRQGYSCYRITHLPSCRFPGCTLDSSSGPD